MRKLIIKFAKLISEYDPRKDAARILFGITGNADFAAELFFDNYLKDLVEDDKTDEE